MPLWLAELLGHWRSEWSQFWHMLVAVGLSLPIGWDREKSTQSAGVRTFPLVAVAACGLWLVGDAISDGEAEAKARVIYGVVTGMGFLGGGAILKADGRVHGLTTAASLWNTAAIGLAVGADQFVVAVTLAVVNFVLLRAKWSLMRFEDDSDGPPGTAGRRQ